MRPRPRPRPITVRPRPRPRLRPKKWSRDHAGLETLTSLHESQLVEMEKAHAGDVADNDSKISDNLRWLYGGAEHNHGCRRRGDPSHMSSVFDGLRQNRPAFNARNAVSHPRQKLGGLCSVHREVDLHIVSIIVQRKPQSSMSRMTSAVYSTNRAGPSTDPCWTPQDTDVIPDVVPLNRTYCLRPLR